MIAVMDMKVENPSGLSLDFNLLHEFEVGLDPNAPENSQIPCRVLGYGEISTVFEILVDSMQGLAFKRMSIFERPEELQAYLVPYREYNHLLEDVVGVSLPAHAHASIINQDGRPIFYIIQEKVPSHSIGNKALHILPRTSVLDLFERVLFELDKIWRFNQSQSDVQLGIDGQISNWVIDDFDPQNSGLAADHSLSYFDTSSPFIRHKGVEQMDAELFLRAAPSFLAWILRLFFLDEVVARYYDPRKVVIDLLANCCKEQQPDLIPDLVILANDFFIDQEPHLQIEPIDVKEVLSYYREDALIWSLYLSMRRVDRFLHKYLLLRPYPYILPGRIQR